MADAAFTIRAGNQMLAIAGSRIVEGEQHSAPHISVPEGHFHPGLINAHDHLHRNHYGRLGKPPYADARTWGEDIQSRYRDRIAEGKQRARRDALLEGAWKNLFAGVTSVVQHDRWESELDAGLPIRVIRLDVLDDPHRLGPAPEESGNAIRTVHLAEGTSARARQEPHLLQSLGWLDANLLAVHCVAMDPAAIAAVHEAGAAVVWCPSSNLFLLGETAPRALLAGADVLLGSDSLLSGAGDLLDELRLARQIGYLPDALLEAAVTDLAARRLGLPLPSLDAGSPADLVVLTRPLLEASAGDVALVVVDGVPRVALPELAPALEAIGFGGELQRRGEITRWTCAAPAVPAIA